MIANYYESKERENSVLNGLPEEDPENIGNQQNKTDIMAESL